jgi:GAF domain-containing protein
MEKENPFSRLASLADELGPALVPPGHDELLESIAETARSLFGAQASSIAMLEDEGEEEERLAFRVAVGRAAESVLDLTIASSQGIAGFVVRSGQPLILEDVQNDPRFASSFADQTGYVPNSIVAVPLETDHGIVGVLEVLDPDGDSVARTRGMELLGHFAHLAALALESAGVFASLGQTLFHVAAQAAAGTDADLAEAFEEASSSEGHGDGELAELAEIFMEFRRLGPDERKTATAILLSFLRYAAAAKGAR